MFAVRDRWGQSANPCPCHLHYAFTKGGAPHATGHFAAFELLARFEPVSQQASNECRRYCEKGEGLITHPVSMSEDVVEGQAAPIMLNMNLRWSTAAMLQVHCVEAFAGCRNPYRMSFLISPDVKLPPGGQPLGYESACFCKHSQSRHCRARMRW